MCGIFGFVGNPDRARSVDLGAAIRALKHRGPDGEGIFRNFENAQMRNFNSGQFRNYAISQSRNAEVACVLAHTRLAILDVSSAGAQPMTTPDGRYTIVHNGEIYNYRELRKTLDVSREQVSSEQVSKQTDLRLTTDDSRERPWRSNSDTEVILRAYERWGADCVEQFRGMFAFAIWDAGEEELFLARDRFGIKPLYYSRTRDGLAFASEIRALLATGLAPRRLSFEGLSGYLAFGSAQEPATILDGVFELPAGAVAEFRGGELSIRSYADISVDTDEDAGSIAVDAVKSEFERAVAGELVSDVPLGVFLSGGMDSAAVAAVASRAASAPIRTFTVSFDVPGLSEGEAAKAAAARFGSDHHDIRISSGEAAAAVPEAIGALDQPSADGINTYLVSRAVRRTGLSVALSGLGGDEVFAGYKNFRRFGMILRAGAAARFLPFRASKRNRDSFNGIPHRLRKLRGLLAAGGDPGATYAVLRGMFLPDERHSLLAPDLASPIQNSKFKIQHSFDAVNLFSRLELSGYLRNTLLRDTDSMSMAHGLEVRVPFLDPGLVDCVLRVPGETKLSRRANKPLLQAAVPALPAEIGARPKQGFVLPMEGWLRGSLREGTDDLMRSAGSADAPFLDGGAVARLWEAFQRGDRSFSWPRVWTIAALMHWTRRQGISQVSSKQ